MDPSRTAIVEAIAANGGDITKAARSLGVARRTLQNRMRKYGMPVGRSGRRPRRLVYRKSTGAAFGLGAAAVVIGGILLAKRKNV